MPHQHQLQEYIFPRQLFIIAHWKQLANLQEESFSFSGVLEFQGAHSMSSEPSLPSVPPMPSGPSNPQQPKSQQSQQQLLDQQLLDQPILGPEHLREDGVDDDGASALEEELSELADEEEECRQRGRKQSRLQRQQDLRIKTRKVSKKQKQQNIIDLTMDKASEAGDDNLRRRTKRCLKRQQGLEENMKPFCELVAKETHFLSAAKITQDGVLSKLKNRWNFMASQLALARQNSRHSCEG